MNLIVVADAITWTALVVSLLAAAALSVLAYLRPRRTYIWFAVGTLAVALLAAASATGPAQFGLAPLITVLGLTVAIFGGSPAAATALDLAMGTTVAPGLHGGIIVAEKRSADEEHRGVQPSGRREVLRGGLTIGVLERIGSAGAIIAGFPEALAIVVAVKGVGRFTELEAPEARERFIIGTFASLIWACAAALVVHLAVR
ncbi:hypothetical protein DCE93_05915 [Agromyces badenianii]|uniref:Uncharacterized protein n=1 Tax=Agromyces badenianii TaxID=2080742 RepID=A0A2S0WVJ0_9MICO|nr:hypothetical protein [Agromyces badenianii]AWB95254.1 hypothetical protein DCE93_05915 [Agromyces badenianii]PWC03331.1 hypothetical protein DCE94_13895 [Agromyces badenianii]